MNNKLTPEKAQELTTDLVDICNTQTDKSRELLEYIIDDYLYRLNDIEVLNIEDIIINQFGYD